MPRRTAQGGWRSRNRDNVAERPSDAPGQRPQSLVLEDELDHHGNVNFAPPGDQVKALPRFFSTSRHGAKNADDRPSVTCLHGTEPLGACLHPLRCDGPSRPGAVRGRPWTPIIHPIIVAPVGGGRLSAWSAQPRFASEACERVCSGFWALFLCFWGRNESGSGLSSASGAITIHPDWLIYSHKSFMYKGLDCVPWSFSRGFFIIWRLKG